MHTDCLIINNICKNEEGPSNHLLIFYGQRLTPNSMQSVFNHVEFYDSLTLDKLPFTHAQDLSINLHICGAVILLVSHIRSYAFKAALF